MSFPNDQSQAGGAIPVWLASPPAGSTGSATSFTDVSGSVTAGGTSQTLNAANPARTKLIVQNPATVLEQGVAVLEGLFINFTAAAGATNGSIVLAPGQMFTLSGTLITGELITVNAATSGHKYTAKVG